MAGIERELSCLDYPSLLCLFDHKYCSVFVQVIQTYLNIDLLLCCTEGERLNKLARITADMIAASLVSLSCCRLCLPNYTGCYYGRNRMLIFILRFILTKLGKKIVQDAGELS